MVNTLMIIVSRAACLFALIRGEIYNSFTSRKFLSMLFLTADVMSIGVWTSVDCLLKSFSRIMFFCWRYAA